MVHSKSIFYPLQDGCVYVYIYIYIFTYIHMSVGIFAFLHTYIYKHIYIYIRISPGDASQRLAPGFRRLLASAASALAELCPEKAGAPT